VVGLDRNWAFNPACKAAKPWSTVGWQQPYILFLKCSPRSA